MYKLNFEYIMKEATNINDEIDVRDSEFIQAIMDYDLPLPIGLYYTFNQINPCKFPRRVCQDIQKKHGNNWRLHERHEFFNNPGETFEDCDNRLIKQLLDKIELPIYIKEK